MKKLLIVMLLRVSMAALAAGAPPVGVIEPTPQHVLLSELSKRTPLPGVSVSNVQADTIRLAFVNLAKGASTPAHNHAGEQIMIPQTGKLNCTLGDQTYIVVPGEVLVIPAWVPHTCEGLVATTILEVHQQTAPSVR